MVPAAGCHSVQACLYSTVQMYANSLMIQAHTDVDVDPEASRNFTMNLFNNPAPVESEDCLYLNVFTPSTPAPKCGRAVLFWIYGGNLQFGTAGQAAYDGSSFAANQDVIVVTTNYSELMHPLAAFWQGVGGAETRLS